MRAFRINRTYALAGLVLALIAGAGAGVGGYTFIYAKGASYLTNDPAACANCHVMQGHFDAWTRSSHHAVAVCNDCHTPAGLIPKYLTKALNGFHHSLAFTTGKYPDAIQITERNRRVAQAACQKCHASITQAIDPPHVRGSEGPLDCLKCHKDVGHLE